MFSKRPVTAFQPSIFNSIETVSVTHTHTHTHICTHRPTRIASSRRCWLTFRVMKTKQKTINGRIGCFWLVSTTSLNRFGTALYFVVTLILQASGLVVNVCWTDLLFLFSRDCVSCLNASWRCRHHRQHHRQHLTDLKFDFRRFFRQSGRNEKLEHHGRCLNGGVRSWSTHLKLRL